MLDLAGSPALVPISVGGSDVTGSLVSSRLSLGISEFSSIGASFAILPIFALYVLHAKFFDVWSSSSDRRGGLSGVHLVLSVIIFRSYFSFL